mgnify:CR=1 FL=1
MNATKNGITVSRGKPCTRDSPLVQPWLKWASLHRALYILTKLGHEHIENRLYRASKQVCITISSSKSNMASSPSPISVNKNTTSNQTNTYPIPPNVLEAIQKVHNEGKKVIVMTCGTAGTSILSLQTLRILRARQNDSTLFSTKQII